MSSSIDLPGLVRRYGDFSLAASTDQPGIRLFGDADGVIAYRQLRKKAHTLNVALGDPLADPDRWGELARGFLAATANAMLVNVGERFGQLLTNEGLYLNPLGWEAILDLSGGYDLSGSKKQNIRNAVSRATAAGYRVDEVDEGDDEAWARLHRLSHSWLTRRSRGRPENALITRPLQRRGRHQRVFVLQDVEGTAVQMLTLDELWRADEIVGYHANINRDGEGAPKNADYVIIAHLIDLLRAHQVPVLSLGLCPTTYAGADRRRNLYSDLFLHVARREGRSIYNFDGLTRHKEEFRPTHRRPVYVAGQEPWPMHDIFGVLKVSNLV
ncbi:DUF2156 domain-containing protein [Nocardioides zeae]|uniref:DUF2156 domain-containing protein n=1 Tax=Nocardioides zeae TaxID=1457234 RepID=A0A6P0HLR2_9ACTN|nr:DUF2156 domain-containing protein [Nocardioides zeae]NEN79553.1 DUF2156 domain-containing protein [Nocardioides zeae]